MTKPFAFLVKKNVMKKKKKKNQNENAVTCTFLGEVGIPVVQWVKCWLAS